MKRLVAPICVAAFLASVAVAYAALFSPGDRVQISGGQHDGAKGEVVSNLKTTDRDVVALDGQEDLIAVDRSQVGPESTPTPEPTPTPDPGPPLLYDPQSPWNTPIPEDQASDSSSGTWVSALGSSPGGSLTSDPTQYAGPLYRVDSSMPEVKVNVTGSWSAYDDGDQSRVGSADPRKGIINIPAGATPSPGSDGHIIFLYDDGTEIAFWQFQKTSTGYQATNGYRYHATEGYMGRMAGNGSDVTSGGGRGAGTPYLAGLVRKEEIDAGVINHALAIAYNSPKPTTFIYPATKTDGRGRSTDPPEGARMQLDPGYDVSNLTDPRAQIMARALQKYGAYVIDNSGSNKIYVEGTQTSGWGSDMRPIMSSIPWSAFRFVPPPAR